MLSTDFFHLFRVFNVWRYSLDHRFQKSSRNWFRSFHLALLLPIVELSVNERPERPKTKSDGVKALQSVGSSVRGESGREFKQELMLASRVDNSSKVRVISPMTCLRWYLVDLTAASHSPPKRGVPWGLKCYLIPWSETWLTILDMLSAGCKPLKSVHKIVQCRMKKLLRGELLQ